MWVWALGRERTYTMTSLRMRVWRSEFTGPVWGVGVGDKSKAEIAMSVSLVASAPRYPDRRKRKLSKDLCFKSRSLNIPTDKEHPVQKSLNTFENKRNQSQRHI